MSAGWSNEETVASLGVWGAAGIGSQLVGSQLDGVSSNRNV